MDSGHILRNGKPVRITSPTSALDNGIAMIHQELKLFPDLSVAENIFYGQFPQKMGFINWGKLYDMADEAIAMLSPDIRGRQKIRELSIAQQQLVEIVRALVKNTEVVIMDEPTASLTGEETLGLFKVIQRIRDSGVSIIFISHRLDEVLEISDRVTVLRDGVLIGTLERGQITGKDQLVDMMLSVKPAVLLEQEHKELGPVVLETRGLCLDKRLRDVSIQLHQGEVLGIAGLVGAGRTELLKTIFGAYTPEQGEILVRGKACHGLTPARAVKLGIAYLSEDRKGEGLLLKMSVEDNEIYACMERYSRLGILSVARRRKTVEEMRQKLRLKASGPGSLTGSLSGGNQQKVVIAKWLAAHSSIILMDEPTRGIDVGAKSEIYALVRSLAQEGRSIIFVSSELEEVQTVSDRILVMSKGAITKELPMNATVEEMMSYAV